MRGYRYEHRLFAVGEVMLPAADPFARLTPTQQVVDRAIRDALVDGDRLRGSSLYAWEDPHWARRAWALRQSPFFYEIEIEDVLFRSDLNHYSDALDAANKGLPFVDAVARYCSKAPLLPHHTCPRVELLFPHARVVSVMTR